MSEAVAPPVPPSDPPSSETNRDSSLAAVGHKQEPKKDKIGLGEGILHLSPAIFSDVPFPVDSCIRGKERFMICLAT
uniref:Uncharacterized protein n=1 Tax=Panagrolaimus sp. PS1159 TaxID=55785 RepID=A0AC35F1J5_9BILA